MSCTCRGNDPYNPDSYTCPECLELQDVLSADDALEVEVFSPCCGAQTALIWDELAQVGICPICKDWTKYEEVA